jgi:hypothetical protein
MLPETRSAITAPLTGDTVAVHVSNGYLIESCLSAPLTEDPGENTCPFAELPASPV